MEKSPANILIDTLKDCLSEAMFIADLERQGCKFEGMKMNIFNKVQKAECEYIYASYIEGILENA